MEGRQQKTCRNCGADVRWAFTNNGKRTLLDSEPDESEGTVAIVVLQTHGTEAIEIAVALRDSGEDRGIDLLAQARNGGVPLRRVHFLNCPARQQEDLAA